MNKPTQQSSILHALKKNPKGVPNYKLASYALKYTSVISDLRKDGHDIKASLQEMYDLGVKHGYALAEKDMEIERLEKELNQHNFVKFEGGSCSYCKRGFTATDIICVAKDTLIHKDCASKDSEAKAEK